MLARWLGLSGQEQRIAVAVGMGAGIGSIFRAPLGGALMAAEILYIHDLEVEALIPALIASIVGYTIFSGAYGYVPIFGNQAYVNFAHPVQLVYYGVLGVICGVGGLLYERSFYGLAAIFHRLPGPRSLKPALGGLLAGDGMSWAAVAEGGPLVGQLHVRDVMETYKANLERSVRRAKALTAGSTLFEVRLDASSPLAGRALRDAGFPRDTLVVSITRDGNDFPTRHHPA
jgi:hypothetical protein